MAIERRVSVCVCVCVCVCAWVCKRAVGRFRFSNWPLRPVSSLAWVEMPSEGEEGGRQDGAIYRRPGAIPPTDFPTTTESKRSLRDGGPTTS